MNPTPIYTEALREAKRRTRKLSPERAALVEMDTRTDPSVRPLRGFDGTPTRLGGSSTGPVVHFGPPPPPSAVDIAREYLQRKRARQQVQR